jgi:hypothetical protein
MKDARGTSVAIGDSVVYHHKQHNSIWEAWSVISWGTVVKINPTMIRVKDHRGKETNKMPHNVVVASLPE